MQRLLLTLLLLAAAISSTALALPTDHGADISDMHDISHITHPHADHVPVDWSSIDTSSHQVIIVQLATMDNTDSASTARHDSMDYAPVLRQSRHQAHTIAARNIHQSGGVIDNANSKLQELGLYSGGR